MPSTILALIIFIVAAGFIYWIIRTAMKEVRKMEEERKHKRR